RARRAGVAARLVDSVCADQSRSRRGTRSATLDRRTLLVQGGLSEAGRTGSRRPGQSRLPVDRRRAEDPAARRGHLGCDRPPVGGRCSGSSIPHCAIACADTLILTSSPTRNPPVSSAVFHISPKSFRLIVSSVSKPTRVLPQGSFASPRYVTGRVTVLATPGMVSVASTSKRSSLFFVTWELTKVSVGCLSTAKKSSERRC